MPLNNVALYTAATQKQPATRDAKSTRRPASANEVGQPEPNITSIYAAGRDERFLRSLARRSLHETCNK